MEKFRAPCVNEVACDDLCYPQSQWTAHYIHNALMHTFIVLIDSYYTCCNSLWYLMSIMSCNMCKMKWLLFPYSHFSS